MVKEEGKISMNDAVLLYADAPHKEPLSVTKWSLKPGVTSSPVPPPPVFQHFRKGKEAFAL